MSVVRELLLYTLRHNVSKAWALSVCEMVAYELRVVCEHRNVTADKLEGGVPGRAVQTCQDCGSVRTGRNRQWQYP